jgi:hypothetical protein
MTLLTVTVLALLTAVIWQDLRTRTVSAWLLPACGIALAVREYYSSDWHALLWNTAINVSLLLLQYLFIHVWLWIRHKRFTKIMDQHIGWGDAIFLLCIAPSFAPLNFCLFVTAGTLFSLLFTIVVRRTKATIPLAGHLSLFLCFGILLTQSGIYSLQLSDDARLTEHLVSILTT